MKFTRKEKRPENPFPETNPYRSRPGPKGRLRAGRRVHPAGRCGGPRAGGRRGAKAPFINRALALPSLIIPLITLLIISFHLLTSPALAAGEGAPSFAWPARGEVINPFTPPRGPYGSGGHAGIDISLPRGSEVRASAPGTVSFSGGTPVGLCVSIVHGGGFKTTYVSLAAAKVRRGQEVERGQVIGQSDGSKDRSSSLPHLHFGMFMNGRAIDPLPLLQGCLLDPGECLFLGPWEDEGAVGAYMSRHDQGGFLGWLGRGMKSAGGAVAGACKAAASAVGEAFSTAWNWACRAARAVGGAFRAFYRRCIEPWFSPLCGAVSRAARWVWSNRFVQALLAGLAAAAVICLAVAGIALAIGISAVAAVVAAAVGSVAAIAYALYYAFASGDSFSFAGCFLSSLAVGGAAAVSSLLVSYMAPLIGAGWSQLGWLGLAKGFLINGAVDSIVYIVFCLATGREVSALGVLATFVLGGLMGGVGKLFMSGLLAEGTVQALAAGFLSSGGTFLSGEGAAVFTAYIWARAVRFAYKAAYVFFCGCGGFLADVVIRVSTGVMPSALESLLSFLGGALAGTLGFAGGGEGITAALSRLCGGRLKFSSELLREAASKLFNKGLKEGISGLLRRLRGNSKKMEEALK